MLASVAPIQAAISVESPMSPCADLAADTADTAVVHIALVPAAGSGQRFGAASPKQYAPLADTPMLIHTVRALLAFESFTQVWIIVCPSDGYAADVLAPLLAAHPQRLRLAYVGGETRAATVRNGLQAMCDAGVASITSTASTTSIPSIPKAASDAWIWVHDAARPAVAAAQLHALHQALAAHPVGAVLAIPVADTLKHGAAQANNCTTIRHTVSRDSLWQAQTPQCFPLQLLSDALDAAAAKGLVVTDEASAIEALGLQPVLVHGSSHNFKVTTPTDAALMEAVLTMQHAKNQHQDQHQSQTQTQTQSQGAQPNIRIGEGMDVHALVAGRPLILGGVTIPHTKGLLGHSDADALLHAITDALLGAAGLGDIGRMFPDTDAAHAGADSQILLKHAYKAVAADGWQVLNVDATIVAQAPKMAAHIPTMQSNIAHCLNIDASCVNVKAKTNEKLGWLGREEGIETRAVIMLAKH